MVVAAGIMIRGERGLESREWKSEEINWSKRSECAGAQMRHHGHVVRLSLKFNAHCLPSSTGTEDMVNLILPPLYILFFCLSFYGLATKPSPFRPLLILPIAGIALYLARFTTTSSPFHDYLLGTLICGNLFSSSDFILLTDVQNELRLVGQSDPISGSSLGERLKWAFKLFIGVRGVGWTHEPTYALRARNKKLSRRAFVIVQAINLVGYVSVLRFLEALQDIYTYLPNSSSNTPIFLLESLRLPLVAYLMAYSHISLSHLLISALSVATGTTNPQDWPHLFGILSDAYTIRRFWG